MPLETGAFQYDSRLSLDLHEHTGRNNKAIERFNRAGGWFKDIDDAFMRPHLELLAGFLIDMGAAQYRVPLYARRHWNRAADPGIGALRMLDDLLRRSIQRPMIIRFHPNSNPITRHTEESKVVFQPAVGPNKADNISARHLHKSDEAGNVQFVLRLSSCKDRFHACAAA
jgi:hypothetical protein